MIILQNEFGPFLNDLDGKTPFAFVTGVRFDAQGQQFLYIAPSELIEQRDAWAWKLTLLRTKFIANLSPRRQRAENVVLCEKGVHQRWTVRSVRSLLRMPGASSRRART